MKLTIKVFASIEDKIGSDKIEIEVPDYCNVVVLLDTVMSQYPQLAEWKKVVRIAVNREYVLNDHIVVSGDEIAIIPPVSGG